MRSRQTGITFIGWVVLLVPLAIIFFAGLKLSTIYMNHFKVAGALEQVAGENQGLGAAAPAAMRRALEKRFDIEGIVEPDAADIVIERDGDEWVLIAQYDREASLMGNLALTVHFNKRVVAQ